MPRLSVTIHSLARRIPAASALLALAAWGPTTGCGHKKPTADRLMNSTSVGQSRCSEVDPTDRPFVVEWDATDMSTFESFAQRDVMLVRYEACELELLTGCIDDGVAGRYGTYNPPMWTSGSVEGFDVKDEYDLYAKLPLGASSLAAQVAGGATLSLQYFISGMVTSAKSAIGKQDLADNPRCAKATHFVQGYNLGAFELNATEGNQQRLEGKHAGVGAGGGHSKSEARLKQGGDLASCTAEGAKELSRCKLPIRLVLRPLEEGAATGLSGPAPVAEVESGPDAINTANNLAALLESARRKAGVSDGAGCMQDLNRAKQVDGRSVEVNAQLWAKCEMLSGQCDSGMKRYVAWSKDETSAINEAVRHCKATGAPPVVRALQMATEIEDASRRPDKPTCAGQGAKLLALVAKMPSKTRDELARKTMAAGALKTAADCADSIGRCPDAKKLNTGYVSHSEGLAKGDRQATIASMNKSLERCGG